MKHKQTLTELNKRISRNILESLYLLDILSDINDGESKVETLLNIIQKNIKCAFHDSEKCRRMTGIID